MPQPDRYAVAGNPVAHSRSPHIHGLFAHQTGQALTYERLLKDSGERKYSTTMAFVQTLNIALRDKDTGPRLVPIVADEARTFGMEGLFRQLGIYAPQGQKYKPVDADQLMFYREDAAGQVLEEGITEAGAFASWLAAATSYSVNDLQMLPFYIYYSMFGFQRIGDLAWAAGDSRAHGFLIGGTAGRTTLNGEGLQHEDGHSHLLSGAIPNCRSYDPTFAHEVAVILQHGMQRMLKEQVDEYWYLTLMNENYSQPDMPDGVEDGIIRGLYRFREAAQPAERHVNLMGSGTILVQAIKAADMLEADFGVTADIWSATSFNELARDGQDAARWNRLNPLEAPRVPYVTQALSGAKGPFIAATDYMKNYAEQIRAFVPGRYTVLGTDGFGFSDTRPAARRFFNVDAESIVVAVLVALARDGNIEMSVAKQAADKYQIDDVSAAPEQTSDPGVA